MEGSWPSILGCLPATLIMGLLAVIAFIVHIFVPSADVYLAGGLIFVSLIVSFLAMQ